MQRENKGHGPHMLPLAEAIESLLQDVASGRFNPDLPIERHRSLFSFEKWVERMDAVYEQALQTANYRGESPWPVRYLGFDPHFRQYSASHPVAR
jgi:hypothetical protein